MTDCLFCKIRDSEIPGDIVYQDDEVLAFRDVNPQAPTHVLVIPRKHIATTNDLDEADAAVVGKMMLAAADRMPSATAKTAAIATTCLWPLSIISGNPDTVDLFASLD